MGFWRDTHLPRGMYRFKLSQRAVCRRCLTAAAHRSKVRCKDLVRLRIQAAQSYQNAGYLLTQFHVELRQQSSRDLSLFTARHAGPSTGSLQRGDVRGMPLENSVASECEFRASCTWNDHDTCNRGFSERCEGTTEAKVRASQKDEVPPAKQTSGWVNVYDISLEVEVW